MSSSDLHDDVVESSPPEAAEYVLESKEDELGGSLYLCLADCHDRRGKGRYTVYHIGLKAPWQSWRKDLNFPNDYDLGAFAGFGTGNSRMFLAGGYGVDYLDDLVVGVPCRGIGEIQINVVKGVVLPPFLEGKVRPLIWEVEGKMFALARNPPPPICIGSKGEWRNCFEMFSWADHQWVSLPDPPSYAYKAAAAAGGVDDESSGDEVKSAAGSIDESKDGDMESTGGGGGSFFYEASERQYYYSSFSFAILGSQIFVSNPQHPHSHKCNLSQIHEHRPVEWKVSPFRFEGVTLGVKTTQGFVVFSYAVCPPASPESMVIKVHLLKNGSDEPVLPQSLMLPSHESDVQDSQFVDVVQDPQFVDLGNQNVCFLYSRTTNLELLVTTITFGFQLEDMNNLRAKFYPTRNWMFPKAVSGMQQMVGAVIV